MGKQTKGSNCFMWIIELGEDVSWRIDVGMLGWDIRGCKYYCYDGKTQKITKPARQFFFIKVKYVLFQLVYDFYLGQLDLQYTGVHAR